MVFSAKGVAMKYLGFLFSFLFLHSASGEVPLPDFILYGKLSANGVQLSSGDLIFTVERASLDPLALTCDFVPNPQDGKTYYICRIPLASRSGADYENADFVYLDDESRITGVTYAGNDIPWEAMSINDYGVFSYQDLNVGAVLFIRGDANDDGKVDLADVIKILLYLYQNDDNSCLDAMDTNDDGRLNLADAVYLLQFYFPDRVPQPPPPVYPYPECGIDLTADGLGCEMRQHVCAGAVKGEEERRGAKGAAGEDIDLAGNDPSESGDAASSVAGNRRNRTGQVLALANSGSDGGSLAQEGRLAYPAGLPIELSPGRLEFDSLGGSRLVTIKNPNAATLRLNAVASEGIKLSCSTFNVAPHGSFHLSVDVEEGFSAGDLRFHSPYLKAESLPVERSEPDAFFICQKPVTLAVNGGQPERAALVGRLPDDVTKLSLEIILPGKVDMQDVVKPENDACEMQWMMVGNRVRVSFKAADGGFIPSGELCGLMVNAVLDADTGTYPVRVQPTLVLEASGPLELKESVSQVNIRRPAADFNGDGRVSLETDMKVLFALIAGPEKTAEAAGILAAFDVNMDGRTDVQDVNGIIRSMLAMEQDGAVAARSASLLCRTGRATREVRGRDIAMLSPGLTAVPADVRMPRDAHYVLLDFRTDHGVALLDVVSPENVIFGKRGGLSRVCLIDLHSGDAFQEGDALDSRMLWTSENGEEGLVSLAGVAFGDDDAFSGDPADSVVLGEPEAVERARFIRGDCNLDGVVDLADVVFLNMFIAAGSVPPFCPDACDVNDDGILNLEDSLYELDLLFGRGIEPACGYDLTPDGLEACETVKCRD